MSAWHILGLIGFFLFFILCAGALVYDPLAIQWDYDDAQYEEARLKEEEVLLCGSLMDNAGTVCYCGEHEETVSNLAP